LQSIWAFGPVGRNIHYDNETRCKGVGRTLKLCCELANVPLFTVSSCLIQIMQSHSVWNAPVLLADIGPSLFVFKWSLLFRGLYRRDRMLPSKIQLQLLPRAKVSDNVTSGGKLAAHTHTHVFIVKPCSLHYGVTDLVERPDVHHRRILVDNSLLCNSERLWLPLFKQSTRDTEYLMVCTLYKSSSHITAQMTAHFTPAISTKPHSISLPVTSPDRRIRRLTPHIRFYFHTGNI